MLALAGVAKRRRVAISFTERVVCLCRRSPISSSLGSRLRRETKSPSPQPSRSSSSLMIRPALAWLPRVLAAKVRKGDKAVGSRLRLECWAIPERRGFQVASAVWLASAAETFQGIQRLGSALTTSALRTKASM